jgi:hypothetical protein
MKLYALLFVLLGNGFAYADEIACKFNIDDLVKPADYRLAGKNKYNPGIKIARCEGKAGVALNIANEKLSAKFEKEAMHRPEKGSVHTISAEVKRHDKDLIEIRTYKWVN